MINDINKWITNVEAEEMAWYKALDEFFVGEHNYILPCSINEYRDLVAQDKSVTTFLTKELAMTPLFDEEEGSNVLREFCFSFFTCTLPNGGGVFLERFIDFLLDHRKTPSLNSVIEFDMFGQHKGLKGRFPATCFAHAFMPRDFWVWPLGQELGSCIVIEAIPLTEHEANFIAKNSLAIWQLPDRFRFLDLSRNS